jgi:BlaI family transcriptional regulator, penicillinase repressor
VARPRIEGLTPREIGIMEVLWKKDEASVQDVQEGLSDRLVDSTIRTLLQIMEKKGYVSSRKEGRANMYRSAIDRGKMQKSALSHMINRIFAGSPEALLARMVEDEHVDQKDLDRVRKLLQER